MSDIRAFADAFEKKNDLVILKVVDYDRTRYLVNAVKDPSKKQYNGTWVGVDKRTGATMSYSPLTELAKFDRLTRENVLYERK